MLVDIDRPIYQPDHLLRLCRRLLPADSSLEHEVRLAADRPDAYLAAFEHRQWRRGIDPSCAPRPDLPWMALLDGLMERGHLVELDWNERPREVLGSIDRLLRERPHDADRWAWVDEAAWTEQPTETLLRALGEYLLTRRLVLACFLVEAQVYPLVILDAAQFVEIQGQADLTGYGRLVACLPGTMF